MKTMTFKSNDMLSKVGVLLFCMLFGSSALMAQTSDKQEKKDVTKTKVETPAKMVMKSSMESESKGHTVDQRAAEVQVQSATKQRELLIREEQYTPEPNKDGGQ